MQDQQANKTNMKLIEVVGATHNKLWVDDERNVPPGWDVARNYDEAIEKLSTHNYDQVSLDHDIASFRDDNREMTGYDIAVWLAERKNDGHYVPPVITVHSANPAGRQRIQGVIDRYLK